MSLPDDLASFLAEVSNLPELWRSIDFRVVAARIEGEWHSLGARAYLDPREPDEVTRFPALPGDRDLVALQWVIDRSHLETILTGVAAGRLEVADYAIRFSRFRDQAAESAYHFGVGFSDIASGLARDYVHYSALYAYGYGSTISEILPAGALSRDRLDASLRLGDAPYDGMGDLERYFLVKPRPTEANTMVAFEIFAPIQVLIDRSRTRIENGKLIVHLTSTAPEFLAECSLGFFGLDLSDLPVQKSLDLGDVTRVDDERLWQARAMVDVGSSFFGKVMLRVGNWCVDRTALYDLHRPGENQRQLAYQVMDPGEALFQKWLFPKSPDQDDQFERAVTRLLMMLGYQVDGYAGTKQLGEGVDLIAHEPLRPVLLAVECTTGPPDSGGKLGRLLSRSRSLSDALPDVEVIPVVVTSLLDEHIPRDHLRAAAGDAIAVVSRDALAELWRALSFSLPVDRVTSLINGKIPSEEFRT